MKKNKALILLFAALLAFSCEKKAEQEEASVLISLGLAATGSKAAALTSDEERFDSWAYWVFTDTGRAVKCGSIGSSEPARINLLTGNYTLFVVANYPTAGSWAIPVSAGISRDALLASVSDLSVNRRDRFLMVGETSLSLSSGQAASVEVNLTRLVCKVGVKRISVDYENPRLGAQTTTLKGIYLTNLWRRTRLGSDYADTELSDDPALWYNAMGWHRSGSGNSPGIDALVGETGIDEVIGAEKPHTTAHYFYCYPNPTETEDDTHDASWGARSSRLVIETEVCGTSFFYQVPIPPMKRNTPYVAEDIIIRKLGSMDPEEVIPGALEVIFSSETAGWEDSCTVTEDS